MRTADRFEFTALASYRRDAMLAASGSILHGHNALVGAMRMTAVANVSFGLPKTRVGGDGHVAMKLVEQKAQIGHA